jgi:pyruvate decarboxylase
MSSQDVPSLQAKVSRLHAELQALKVGGEQITIADYLLKRLEQLGVKHMFGVPGDFNLAFLDYVEDFPTIDWVGNCNELNAAYAADGYARVNEHSIGAVTTTFGVGELSATNGIAGAFSEIVPVLHIAGVPSTDQQSKKTLLHHTLGDGRFDAYRKAAEQFTISQANITNKTTAAAQIDRILTDLITSARPVYLTLPTNMVAEKIPSASLATPLSRSPPPNDPAVENFVLEEIGKLAKAAQGDGEKNGIVILVDACAIRHGVREEVRELCEKTGFPVYAAPMGKTAISENYERYGGIYIGSITHPDIKEKIENAKLILSIGALKSDFNTGNFTYSIPVSNTIELHSDHTNVQYATFPAIGMKQLLPKLTKLLSSYRSCALNIPVPPYELVVPTEPGNEKITHNWFWPKVAKFFKPKDIIVSETGTSNFGLLDVPFPHQSVFVSQILWGSIGWATGSALGAAIAGRDLGLGRVILFIGDGSIQLTVQEISTMIRLGLKPIIFVLNNEGYTIERCIHGKNRKYNDIANWHWTGLLKFFGDDPSGKLSKSYTVHNKLELSNLLDDASFAGTEKIQLVEVMMDKFDAPRGLKVQTGINEAWEE